MDQRQKSGGALFVRDKNGRSAMAPDWGGDVTLEGDVLDYVLRKAQSGGEVKLELSAWKRQGRNNTTFISLAVQTPYAERQQQEAPQRRMAPQRNEYADRNEGFQTSRGRYPPADQGRQRQELNDDIPDLGSRRRRPLNDEPPF
jgi:hypothetical protein